MPEFAVLVAAAELARLTNLPFVTAPNKFEALAANDPAPVSCPWSTEDAGGVIDEDRK